MGKPKKPAAPNKADGNFKIPSNKILTKDGKVKKKIPKQFNNYHHCEYCDKKFEKRSGLLLHEKIHLNLQFPCKSCSFIAKTKKYLACHVRQVHRAPKHACHCGKAFAVPSALREHAMVHTGEKPHKCGECGKAFRVTYTLNMHMLIHKNEKPFKCSFCAYACRDSSTLRRHEYRHMGYVRTFDCKICPKKFEHKSKLKYHISSVHLNYLNQDLKKHKCEHCDKKFQLKSQLTSHIEYTHDPTQVCDCPICGKQLKHKRYLHLHMRTHFDERPHACGHRGCGKRFKGKGDLKKHSIIHTPQLHQPCPKCGMKFSRPERLAKHMRTHEPREKSVICDYCGVAFFTKNYLIKHITQKHCEEKKKYICDNCGLVTYNKPSIVMHIKYGRCRDEERYCKLCKYPDKYKTVGTLRSHYLNIHNIKYKPRKNKKNKLKDKKAKEQPSVEVKVEPVDSDPFEEVQISIYSDVKEENDKTKEGEESSTEDDILPYSNSVLSEELQEYLLRAEGEAPESDIFDACLIRQVFHIPEKVEVEDKRETDEQQEAIVTQKIKDLLQKAQEDKTKKKLERKKRREAKLLEKKLKREAKLMRQKRRREKYELERLILMYNERMKRAAEQALNKKKGSPKKIIYFKKKTVDEKEGVKNKDTTEIANSENDLRNNNDSEINNQRNNVDNINNSNSNENSVSDTIIYDANEDNSFTNGGYRSDHIEIGTILESDQRISKNHDNVDTPNIESNKFDLGTGSVHDKLECANEQKVATNDSQKLGVEAEIYTSIQNKISKNNEDSSTNNGFSESTKLVNGTKGSDKEIDLSNGENSQYKENSNYELRRSNRKRRANKRYYDGSTINHSNGQNGEQNQEFENDDYVTEDIDETVPNKKMNFKSFQCYVCFKLFPTKQEQLAHSSDHFDVCNTTNLTKCPICGFVTSSNIGTHMKKEHDMDVSLSHKKITKREGGEGSKYCLKVEDAVIEVIPSVKNLNYQASIAIDKTKREMKDMTVAKTKLVKKGNEWMLEKVAVDASAYQELPQFTGEELSKLPVSSNYTERLGQLGRLARSKGLPMLYPCNQCDKICQVYAALRLHERRHDPEKKPFAPKKYKRDCETPVPQEKPKAPKNLEHRSSKPKPIKSKHRCDDTLKKFYETYIRGENIEFWQFLKIYNKMDRENVNDFKDLESRLDFGIHTTNMSVDNKPRSDVNNTEVDKSISNSVKKNTTVKRYNKNSKNSNLESSKYYNSTNDSKNESNMVKRKYTSAKNSIKTLHIAKLRKVPSKMGQQNQMNKPYKRVVLLSKKERIERKKLKKMMREKFKGKCLNL